MSLSTPVYGFRYPGVGDDPNVPRDVKQLAEDVEAAVARVENREAAAHPEARWARLSGTQPLFSGRDNQLRFPHPVRTDPAAVPFGPGDHDAFAVAPGVWLCVVSLRLSAAVAGSGELSVAFGDSSAWRVGDVVACGGSGTVDYNVTALGVRPGDGTPRFFTASFWHSSGQTVDAAVFGQATSIDLVRLG